MRTLAASLALTCLVCVAAPSFSGQACEQLDPDSKKAVLYVADDAYGLGQFRSEDAEEIQWANKLLVAKGHAVLPCLLDIYHHGVHGDLWRGKGAPPTSGRWALPLIRSIDGPSAIPLYRELYSQASDYLTRVQFAADLVGLGDDEHLSEIASFLNAPPVVPSDRPRAFSAAVERALVAVSVRDYRAVLPALRKLADNESIGDKHVLAVYIAQLSGDVETVRTSVGDPRVRNTALLALKRMGQTEVLRQVADDRTNPASTREAARFILDGKLGS